MEAFNTKLSTPSIICIVISLAETAFGRLLISTLTGIRPSVVTLVGKKNEILGSFGSRNANTNKVRKQLLMVTQCSAVKFTGTDVGTLLNRVKERIVDPSALSLTPTTLPF